MCLARAGRACYNNKLAILVRMRFIKEEDKLLTGIAEGSEFASVCEIRLERGVQSCRNLEADFAARGRLS